MIDLLGRRLCEAKHILQGNKLNWEIELTGSTEINAYDGQQAYFRVVRQKILSDNRILLTVVRDEKGGEVNGD